MIPGTSILGRPNLSCGATHCTGVYVKHDSREKVCTLCGEDCSKRKRAKDARGRYYCLECFERRLDQVQHRRASVIEEVRASVLSSSDSKSESLGVDADLLASEADAVEKEKEVRPVPCTGCGRMVDPHAVLCIHCGHDFQAGLKLKVKKRVLSRERPAIWPTVAGVLCMLFGAAGLVFYGRELFRAVMASFAFEASTQVSTVTIAAFAVLFALSAVHVLGGMLTWLHFSSGIATLRFWLWAKLLAFTLVLLGGATTIFAFPAFVDGLDLIDHLDLSAEQREPWPLAKLLGAVWLWQCAWPLALLFLFETPQVEKDIAKWDEPEQQSTALHVER